VTLDSIKTFCAKSGGSLKDAVDLLGCKMSDSPTHPTSRPNTARSTLGRLSPKVLVVDLLNPT
jgi:hypothetical protein